MRFAFYQIREGFWAAAVRLHAIGARSVNRFSPLFAEAFVQGFGKFLDYCLLRTAWHEHA